MKYLIFSILFSLSFSLVDAQTPALNRFYHQQKLKKGTISFTVPAFLIRFGGKIAGKHVDENDKAVKFGMKLIKSFKKTKILVRENMAEPIPEKDIKKVLNSIDKKKSFEHLLMIRAEGVRVNIAIKEKNNTIKNLLLLVSEEDTFVMLSMKTKLKLDELTKAIEEMMYDVQEERRRKKELEEKEEKKKPQA